MVTRDCHETVPSFCCSNHPDCWLFRKLAASVPSPSQFTPAIASPFALAIIGITDLPMTRNPDQTSCEGESCANRPSCLFVGVPARG